MLSDVQQNKSYHCVLIFFHYWLVKQITSTGGNSFQRETKIIISEF